MSPLDQNADTIRLEFNLRKNFLYILCLLLRQLFVYFIIHSFTNFK